MSRISCRLSERYTFADARDNIFATYVWFTRSDNMFDRSRIVFFGASTCGGLAVEAAIATGSPAVAWSAPLDLIEFDADDHAGRSSIVRTRDETRPKSNASDSLRTRIATFAPDRPTQEEASPIYRVDSTCGPVYLANSLDEAVPIGQPLRMQSALAMAGVASTVQLLSGSRHGYEYIDVAIEPTIGFILGAARIEPDRPPSDQLQEACAPAGERQPPH